MAAEPLIFVGFELTPSLRQAFEECPERHRVYLDDPQYLETVTIDERQFVGKSVKNGAAVDRLEDVARNVVSLISRIDASRPLSPRDALIVAAEAVSAAPSVQTVEDADSSGDFEYSGLIE